MHWGSEICPSFSDVVRGETARQLRLAVHNGSGTRRFERERDIDAWAPLAQRLTSRRQPMEIVCMNVAHVPYLGRFRTDGWGRLPNGCRYLGRMHKETV